MAKKVKEVPFDKVANLTEYGTWEWTTGGLTWWWKDGLGLNTGIKINDELRSILYCKTIAAAGMFAEGFAAGVQYNKNSI